MGRGSGAVTRRRHVTGHSRAAERRERLSERGNSWRVERWPPHPSAYRRRPPRRRAPLRAWRAPRAAVRAAKRAAYQARVALINAVRLCCLARAMYAYADASWRTKRHTTTQHPRTALAIVLRTPRVPGSRIRVFARPPTCTHVARGLVLVCSEGSLPSTARSMMVGWVYQQWWSIPRYVLHLVTYRIHHPKQWWRNAKVVGSVMALEERHSWRPSTSEKNFLSRNLAEPVADAPLCCARAPAHRHVAPRRPGSGLFTWRRLRCPKGSCIGKRGEGRWWVRSPANSRTSFSEGQKDYRKIGTRFR